MDKLKIIIATGIYPPDAGGPATFAKKIFDGLKSRGQDISVVTFCREEAQRGEGVVCVSTKGSALARYLRFFFRLWKLSKDADVIYSFDLLSVGLACAFLKLLRPKIKLVFRVGGDFQWEAALQKGYFDGTIWRYWEEKKFGRYESIVYRLTNFSLKKANLLVFNANLIRDVFIRYRGVAESRTRIIKNIAPETVKLSSSDRCDDGLVRIIFIGRLIAMKNLIRLIRALEELIRDASLEKRLKLELDGEGPEARNIIDYVRSHDLGRLVKIGQKISHERVLEVINDSDIVANVSLTEVNAHFASEALALKKRLILTKESEQFYTGFKNELIYYVDPLDVKDIAIQILRAIKDLDKKNVVGEVDLSDAVWPLEKVLAEHASVFSGLLNEHEKNN